MTNEYQTIKDWAVNNVADQKSRKAILNDLKSAFAKDTKAKAWFTSLYRLGEHESLVKAVQSIAIQDRTRTETEQSCWMCGTGHNDTYLGEFKGAKVSIGNVCARKRLSRYGLNVGVLTEAEEKTRTAKAKQVQEDLEILVSGEKIPVVLLDHKPAKKNESYMGTLVGWVLQQDKAPDNVLAAARRIRDNYSRSGRNDIRAVLDFVAKERKLPAEAFEPIAKDIELMEQEKLAPEGLAKQIRSAKELTGAQADALLGQTRENQMQYRIRNNSEALKKYEKPLAAIIGEITPVVEQHDRPLWREDLAAQLFRYNKVLSAKDYRLVARCLRRWTFNSTRQLEGADRLRLRNIAVRIEPVSDFRQIIGGLVTISRKLQYAKDHAGSEERQQLERIKAEISRLPDSKKHAVFRKFTDQLAEKINDPCRLLKSECYTPESLAEKTGITDLQGLISRVDRSYAMHDSTWANNHPRIAVIKEYAKYGIIPKEDIGLLNVLDRRVRTYSRIDIARDSFRQVQQASSSRLVTEMPCGIDRETFANADCIEWAVKKALLKQAYIDPDGKKSLARDSIIRIAAGDYSAMRRKLGKYGLREENVLEMRQALGNSVTDAQVTGGRQLKYICPAKVKMLYDQLRTSA